MISLDELRDTMRINADKNNNYIMEVIGDLFKDIEEKNKTIAELNRKVEFLSKELEDYIEKDIKSQSIIKDFSNRLEKSRNLQNQNLLVITSHQEAFGHKREIALEYLSKLKWTSITFECMMDILDAAFKNGDTAIIDEVIFCIADNRLKSFSHEQFNTLMVTLKDNVMANKTGEECPVSGIIYLYNRIEELGWSDLLKPYIKLISFLAPIIVNTNISEIRCHNSLTLLRVLFLIGEYERWKDMVVTFQESGAYSGRLEKEQSLELLYESLYCDMDGFVIDNIAAVSEVLTYQMPETKCYHLYYEAVADPQAIEKTISEIKEWEKKCNHINTVILQKVFKKLYSNMSKLLENYLRDEENDRIAAEKEEYAKAVQNKYLKDPNIPTAEVVYFIKKSESKCKVDKTELVLFECNLALYESPKAKPPIIKGYIRYKVFYCKSCNRYYINHDIFEKMKPLFPGMKLKIVESDTIMKINSINNDFSDIIYFNYSKKSVNEGINDDPISLSIDPKSLKEQSNLHKLGYSLNLTKEQRWDIIQRKAIPRLGVYEIIRHLENMINWRSKQKARDFTNAINEWEYDINRIKQNYKIK